MTSTEWLLSELEKVNYHPTEAMIMYANKLHKQEIIESVLYGMQKGLNVNKVPETDSDWVNNYYNKTFKKDKL